MTESLLAEWLPRQRWFAGKGRAVTGVAVERSVSLLQGEADVSLQVLGVTSEGEGVERYQLLLGARHGDLPDRLAHAEIGRSGDRTLYDAAHDVDATARLLGLLAAATEEGGLSFRQLAELRTDLSSRVIGAEQSNTSLVFGEEYILKLFRRLQLGTNPDLEVTRALTAAGSEEVAPPLAWFETELDGTATTLGLLQPYLANASEGWAMATTSVRDLFAEADLHADEVGGDFAAESSRLGATTGSVHRLLARTLPTEQAGRADLERLGDQLCERLEAAIGQVPELAAHREGLQEAYGAVRTRPVPMALQRIHGDLHLGQVLRTQSGWVLLDFEGEPARPLAERVALMSPLRDVAGMLRSFDYAAQHLLAERGADPQLAYRAAEWAERNRAAFCTGYAESAGADPREDAVLLRAFELDKAVYEVAYEARNRPQWLSIPMGSIARLIGAGA